MPIVVEILPVRFYFLVSDVPVQCVCIVLLYIVHLYTPMCVCVCTLACITSDYVTIKALIEPLIVSVIESLNQSALSILTWWTITSPAYTIAFS